MILVAVVIMKNEYATYKGLLDTLKGSDLAVLVHSGSEQPFIDLLDSHVKNAQLPYKVHIAENKEWHDCMGFDEMRNYADACARQACINNGFSIEETLFLSIDCDERLPVDWDTYIRIIHDQARADSYRTKMQNGDGPTYWQRKLYRYGAGLWLCPVHEVYVLRHFTNARSFDMDLTLTHLYNANPPRSYMDLMEKHLRANRHDSRFMYYYFRERHYSGKDSDLLLQDIYLYLKDAGTDMHTDMLAQLFLSLGTTGNSMLLQALRHCQTRQSYYLFANAANNAEEFTLAFHAAVVLQEQALLEALIPIDVQDYHVHWITGSACYGIGWYEKACYYFGMSMQTAPEEHRARLAEYLQMSANQVNATRL